jgi:hypothetical protein
MDFKMLLPGLALGSGDLCSHYSRNKLVTTNITENNQLLHWHEYQLLHWRVTGGKKKETNS